MPNWTVYFTAYQWSKKQYGSILSTEHQHAELFVNVLASVTAGAISNTLLAPMWTIRTRLITQSNREIYRNSFDAARKIYRTEGLSALYRGLMPSLLGLVRRVHFDKLTSTQSFLHNEIDKRKNVTLFNLDSCWYSIPYIRISEKIIGSSIFLIDRSSLIYGSAYVGVKFI